MSRLTAAVVILGLFAARGWASPTPPWLIEASHRPIPSRAGAADAIVLHDEKIVEVRPQGPVRITTRMAIRVVSDRGAAAAVATVEYVRGSSRVHSFDAWTLAPNGKPVREWSRKQAADVSDLESWQLYGDFRHLVLSDDAIRPGQTFAYCSVTEEEPLFAQWSWRFRSSYPSARSRFEIRLPAGLEPVVHGAQLDSVTTRRDPGVWSWEMNDLAASTLEPLAPSSVDLEPSLRIQVVSIQGDRSVAGLAFRDWSDVSDWIAALAAPGAAVLPELAARASALTADATDSLTRIQSIASFVQSLNYVSMQAQISRGWGYRPHDAASVLQSGYGDCKDKAGLLCTLLRAAGYEAWLMPVFSGGRDHVDSGWVSPTQFNHCIAAIRMPSTYRGPLIENPRYGRVLPFDPTDPLTVFGDLPATQQGSWALLVREGAGELVRLPVQTSEANHVARRIEGEIDASGRLRATLVERSVGQCARIERNLRRSETEKEYRNDLETRLSSHGGIELRSWSAAEGPDGSLRVQAEYESPSFARTVGQNTLVFRSAFVSSRDNWMPTDTVRTMPIALYGQCVVETLVIHVPAGFVTAERPADMRTISDLGRFHVEWTMRDRHLVMTRRWELYPVTVGRERWHDVLSLYGALRSSNIATVVLTRP